MSNEDPEQTQEFEGTETVSSPPHLRGDVGSRLRPGATIGGRFRVLRLLGRGGMGEVYAAEDLELRETIAIKTVTPGRIGPRGHHRLRREVQLARRISHPNVCRLFDVFRFPEVEGSAESLFVTMELLPGATLGSELERAGRLPLDRSLNLSTQIAGALEAAHLAGVLHRDLKPSNVMLIPQEPGRPERAIVTDFGLATTVPGLEDSQRATDTGEILGTPAYMSPEQVRGSPSSARTDVYAFGLLLFEMLCATSPFRSGSPIECASRRLTDAPEDPRVYRQDLPDWVVELLRKCLAREPENRWQSMSAVLQVLRTNGEASRPSAWRTPVVRWGLLGLGVISVAVASPYLAVRPQPTVPSPRETIGLLGFTNRTGSGQLDYVSTALVEGLEGTLKPTAEFRIIAPDESRRVRAELALTSPDAVDAEAARRIGQNLSIRYVVVGNYNMVKDESGARIMLHMRVHETTQGASIASITRSGSEADLVDLIASAAADLKQRFGLAPSPDETLRRARTSLPSNAAARRAFAEGLDALSRSEGRLARDRFEQTIAHEHHFAHGHIQLSYTYRLLGFDAEAAKQAAIAIELARDLPASERRWIEAISDEVRKDWSSAIAKYEAIFRDDADLEQGLRLVYAQIGGARLEDAKDTVRRLKELQVAGAMDARILIAEANIAEAQGDAALQAKISASAIESATSRGAPLLIARACLSQARAAQTLGDLQTAKELNERGKAIYQEAGDRRGVAAALINLGGILDDQGDSDGALQALHTALRISRELGTYASTAMALNDLASVLFGRGDFSAAGRMYDEALDLSRQVGDKNAEARALGNKASVLYEQEQVARSLDLNRESLRVKRRLGNQRAVAFTLINMGDIATELGQLEEAAEYYEEGRTIASRLDDKDDHLYALIGLTRVWTFRDDLTRAVNLAEDAVRLSSEQESTGLQADARLAKGFVLLYSDRVTDAIDLLRALAALKDPEADLSTRVHARALLALALLQQGNRTDAQNVLGGLPQKDRGSVSLAARYMYDLAEALASPSTKGLTALRQKARKSGLKAYELQIALASHRMQSIRKTVDAGVPLPALITEAERYGFKLIARLGQAAAKARLGESDSVQARAFPARRRHSGARNHPNIAHIYGLEGPDPAAGCSCTRWELVAGGDPSQRIARAPIPIHDAPGMARMGIATSGSRSPA